MATSSVPRVLRVLRASRSAARPAVTATASHAQSRGGAASVARRGDRRALRADSPRAGRLVPSATRDTKREVVIPEPSYNVPLALVGLSGLSAVGGNLTLTGLFGVLGFFLLFQAQRVRFVFTDEDLQVLIGDELEKSGENAFVGGENKWKYDTFVNWEFWWPGFPCLVYFKETQTKPEGQIHFFPIIMDGQQLYDVMVERCGNSQNSLPDN